MFSHKDGSNYIEFGKLETTLVDEQRENDIIVYDDNMDYTW